MINHATRQRFWVERIVACDDDQRREALYQSMPMNEKYATTSAANDVWLDMKLPNMVPPEARESSVYAQLQDCVRNLPDTPRTKWLIHRIFKDVTRDLEHKLKGETMSEQPKTSEAKPTPGPWRCACANDQDGHPIIVGDIRPSDQPHVDGEYNTVATEVAVATRGNDEIAEADARLIAAAPETAAQRDQLLAACEAALIEIKAAIASGEVVSPSLKRRLEAAIASTKGDASEPTP